MPHVVTQACCGDASCVYACPVNCIHPTPDEPDFGTSEMLYIDPSSCVDCGACVSACPVDAIVPGHRLDPAAERFREVNAAHFGAAADAVRFPVATDWRLPLAPISKPKAIRGGPETLRVAIVGSGPSAMYAADELLKQPSARITIFERLALPFGLARYGVAPDHGSTRRVMDFFDDVARHQNLEIRLGVQVGQDVTLSELRSEYHAVLWAGGAPTDRPLPLDGAALPGVQSATSLVGWYNGHPDHADAAPDLSGERAVVIGNGNVALDVARILTSDPATLATTSIARTALAALRSSQLREVVVVARRGPEHAAFTLPELIGLADRSARVWVDPADLAGANPDAITDPTIAAKVALLQEISGRPRPSGPHVRLAFDRTPVALTGERRVTGVQFTTSDGSVETLSASAVFTAIGYRGVPVPGLPFDEATGTIPHQAGRVLDGAEPMRGVYVTGWIKRGPSGFIGTNKSDSGETVGSMLADAQAGVLTAVETH